MTILLFGADGQLGWELQRSLSVLGEVVALGRSTGHNPGHLAGDLADPDGLRRTLQAVRPAVIVNAAAYTQVERAEQEPELAQAINGNAPGLMASEAERLGAWLVHYSTDYVFDGSKDGAWTETDPTHPLNAYGRSKLAGEQAVRAACTRHLVLRTSWVHAVRGGNFIRNILRAAAEKPALDVVSDQWGAPTSAAMLADATAHMLRAVGAVGAVGASGTAGGVGDRLALSGLYHCTASGSTNWQAYAQFVVDEALQRGWTLAATADRISPARTADRTGGARRPLNSRLDCSKLQAAFGLTLPDWQGLVRRTIDGMRPAPSP